MHLECAVDVVRSEFRVLKCIRALQFENFEGRMKLEFMEYKRFERFRLFSNFHAHRDWENFRSFFHVLEEECF